MKEHLWHLWSNVQLRRYIVVGGLGTLLDIGIYSGLRFLSIWHWVALAVSFTTGITVGFILTRRWVFRSTDPLWERQLLRFLIVVGIMYFVNGLIMEGLYWILPAFAGRSLVVRGAAAATALPLSFTLHRRVSFANFD
ncbi:MAG: GtrA family protein [Bacteroidia bacterium]|nr:GtrA family protein [Bacteroidia bacterium]MCX7764177.1 GtrA family protein [Bacteroidia bacterium]MDW8057231.1 GtrA family protein [Bacteroidia bacterium]